jgi:hypothetical protein
MNTTTNVVNLADFRATVKESGRSRPPKPPGNERARDFELIAMVSAIPYAARRRLSEGTGTMSRFYRHATVIGPVGKANSEAAPSLLAHHCSGSGLSRSDTAHGTPPMNEPAETYDDDGIDTSMTLDDWMEMIEAISTMPPPTLRTRSRSTSWSDSCGGRPRRSAAMVEDFDELPQASAGGSREGHRESGLEQSGSRLTSRTGSSTDRWREGRSRCPRPGDMSFRASPWKDALPCGSRP